MADTYVEVSLDTLKIAEEKAEKIHQVACRVIASLENEKIKVKTWFFFNKEISVWQYCQHSSWKAEEKGFISSNEAYCIRMYSYNYYFKKYAKFTEKAFLCERDHNKLIDIMEVSDSFLEEFLSDWTINSKKVVKNDQSS